MEGSLPMVLVWASTNDTGDTGCRWLGYGIVQGRERHRRP